jgi:glycosyltransferase involved in cell wall biosynthesis
MKKKLWIMNHYAVPSNMGGITRQYDYAKELVDRGYDVIVIASSFDGKTRREKLCKSEKFRIENIEGVKFIWIKTSPYKKNDFRRFINMISFAINSYKVCRKLEKPNTIIASSVHPFTWLSGYFLSRKDKAKFIAEVRDLWPQVLIDMGAIKYNSLPAKFFRTIEMFIYRKADNIITVLPDMKDYIKNFDIDEKKIIYIPNGVNIKKIDINRVSDVSPKILKNHNGKFKFIYLGAMSRANHLSTLIEAALNLRELGYEKSFDILIVGDGPDKKTLIDMKDKYNLSNVYFYEPVDKIEVYSLLKGIDVCIFNLGNIKTYKNGISPNKLFDYMFAKKPIVFACNTKHDIVKFANAGISIEAENPKVLCETMITMIKKDKYELERMGQNGCIYLKENHDIGKLASRLEDII